MSKGFSLIEVMVSMTISSLLVIGLLEILNDSVMSMISTNQYSQLQENGRIALTIIEQDLSQAGFFGDMTGSPLVFGQNTSVLGSETISNDCTITGSYGSIPKGTEAYRFLWAYHATGSEDLDCFTGKKPTLATDVIQFKRLQAPSILNDERSDDQNYVATSKHMAVFVEGQEAVPEISNERYWKLLHHVYYIDEDSGVPALRRRVLDKSSMKGTGVREQQLVQGIEDIHYLFGIDSNADSNVDAFVSATSVPESAWSIAGEARIIAVRVYVLVRSIEEDPSYTNTNTYEFGQRVLTAPNDHFRRKVLSTTVVLENFL